MFLERYGYGNDDGDEHCRDIFDVFEPRGELRFFGCVRQYGRNFDRWFAGGRGFGSVAWSAGERNFGSESSFGNHPHTCSRRNVHAAWLSDFDEKWFFASLKTSKNFKKHEFHFFFASFKNLKKHEFHFFFASLKKLKKHEFHFFFASLKNLKKHDFHFLQA